MNSPLIEYAYEIRFKLDPSKPVSPVYKIIEKFNKELNRQLREDRKKQPSGTKSK